MTATFLTDSIKRFEYYKELGDKTLDLLTTDDVNYSPHPATCNSIATIVVHLYGNMLSRWTDFLTTDGEKDWRRRNEEFLGTTYTKNDVMSFWNEGWKICLDTLKKLEASDLEKTIYIRQEPLTVYDAILRQLAHYPYHIGQMVYLGKMITQQRWINLSIPTTK
ncbi:MAG: DUF1572 domain-containing protein [Bacteroidetes bacterium]|nr:MAG: DUF1572 domain-containing protein [Bacteroidota bacterium]